MPNIPLYHFRPQGSGSANVRANPSMLEGEHRAASALGQAVAGLADPAVKLMSQIQAAQRFKHQAELDAGMQEAWDKFQDGLNPSTDETKWQEQWGKTFDATVAKLMPKNAGERTLQELKLRSLAFKATTSGDVGHQAKAAGVTKAKLAGESRVSQLWRNGDDAGAVHALHEMASLGLILPEEVPAMVRKGQQVMQRQQALSSIMADPVAASEHLNEKTPSGRWKNFTNIDEDDRLTLINHARYQSTALRTDTFNSLIEGLQVGEAKSPAELDSLVARKLITPVQRKSYEKAYRHGQVTTDPVAISELFTDISKYDPKADADFTGRAKLLGRIATGGFPQNVQSEANELLGKKANPKDPLNSPVAKDAFEAIDQRFKAGLYGNYEVPVFDATAPMGRSKKTVPAAYEKALLAKRRVEDVVRGYIATNPNATAEQLNKVVTDAQQGQITRTGRNLLLNGLGLQGSDTHSADDANARRARLDAILSKDAK